MKYVGVDLHKKTISICVLVQSDGKRTVIGRSTLGCGQAGMYCRKGK